MPVGHLAQEAIAALVDGELSSGAATRAARHLVGCGQCRLAVEAQREAKSALVDTSDVVVPMDLMSRLRDIPFTADVPGGSAGSLFAVPGALTGSDDRGSWSLSLTAAPSTPPGHARWFRRSMIGVVAGVGVGVAVLAANLPADQSSAPAVQVAGPGSAERTEIVPPVVRTITIGNTAPAPAGGTP